MQATGPVKPVYSMPLMERIAAAIIDIIIVGIIALFPRIGWLLGLLYHLTKDSIPILGGQSFGKKLLRIKTITIPEEENLIKYPEKSVLRGLISLIPVLNIIDVWYLFARGRRLADIWSQTTVILYNEDEND